jgi:hypothetical protein
VPNLIASIPHQLTRAKAKRRIQDGLSNVRRQYAGMLGGLRETWHDDSIDFTGTVMGQHISGSIDVGAHDVYLEAALPDLLGMATVALRPFIERQGRRLLAGPASRQPTDGR